jgi:phytanoyl-CoA hydroxylase
VYEAGAHPPRLRNAFRMHLYLPFFMKLAHHPPLVTIMKQLLGSPLRLYSSQMFFKPAKVGSEVPWHQDMAYWPFHPAEMATAWIALDDTSVENGCVRFLKGSHKKVLLPHEASGVKGNSLKLSESALPEGYEELAVEVSKGSVVIHHCPTLHRSEPNRSHAERRGLLYIYMSPNVAVTDVSRLKGGTEFPTVAAA